MTKKAVIYLDRDDMLWWVYIDFLLEMRKRSFESWPVGYDYWGERAEWFQNWFFREQRRGTEANE